MSERLLEQLQLLPDYLGSHLILTLCALAAGLAISLPAGILGARYPGLRVFILSAASVVQTIPGLAMLAAMVILFSRIGFVPAFFGLVLYSVLPMLRNTVTGLSGVDASVVEAARGIGMTPAQVMLRVRFPLALPVIIAGIRTATVWTVGIATLSTPVGAISLGNYIFSGLQTRNNAALLVGCVASALLALLLDALIHLLEVATQRRSKPLAAAGGLVLTAVILAGLAPAVLRLREAPSQVTVGAKGFTEQYILGELIQRQLEARDIKCSLRANLGSTVVFEALAAGDIHCYVDYTGTIWANHMKREDILGPEETFRQVRSWLESEHGITVLGKLGFENAYALAMRSSQARELGVASIEDLARHADSLRMGSDYEFFSRPEWESLEGTYGLSFSRELTFDPALMYEAVREEQVDVIPAFTTDGRIIAFDLRILEDPRDALPPYDAIVMLGPGVADFPGLMESLSPLVDSIGNQEMREANKLVDQDKQSIGAAVEFLRSQ